MNLAHDDDGIIDLRALKSTPPPPGSFGAVAFSIGSPFLSEPPPGAFALDADAESGVVDAVSRRSSRAKGIGIAAGAALFVVLAAVGIGFAFRGAKPANVASASTTPAAPPVVAAPPPAVDPAPATPVAAAAAAAPVAADDKADDTSSSDSASAKGKKAKGKGRAAKSKSSAGLSANVSASTAAKPAAASKAADPCHCHGDFQCNIRCSANR